MRGVLLIVAAVVALVASAFLASPAGQSASPVVGIADHAPAVSAAGAGSLPNAPGTKTASPLQADTDVPETPEDAAPDTTADATSSGTASAFIEVPSLTVPQTYIALVDVKGWRDESSSTLEIAVREARLAGPIDAITGEETDIPEPGTRDHSRLLMGRRLLASATPAASGSLAGTGEARVRLVLMPSGAGAVLIVDGVES